jgi:predicted enzyme related to lactoylglutathione lyase
MTRPVVNFQIWAKDPEAQRNFYREIFGWDISEPTAFGISTIAAGIGGPEEGVGGTLMGAGEARVLIYVQVLDPLETLAKAEALGGRRVLEPFDVPGGPTVAQMADPEGNVVGLVKQ